MKARVVAILEMKGDMQPQRTYDELRAKDRKRMAQLAKLSANEVAKKVEEWSKEGEEAANSTERQVIGQKKQKQKQQGANKIKGGARAADFPSHQEGAARGSRWTRSSELYGIVLPRTFEQVPNNLKELVLENEMQDCIVQTEAPVVTENRRHIQNCFVWQIGTRAAARNTDAPDPVGGVDCAMDHGNSGFGEACGQDGVRTHVEAGATNRADARGSSGRSQNEVRAGPAMAGA